MRRGEVRWYRFSAPDKHGPVVRGRLGALVTTLNARRLSEIRAALLFALGY
ncbi:hypothetical protein L6Q96_04110 [Candidatus Binatia bacterium]|nr:hypothetical protein [Candidatus Binatia bacterium]